MKRSIIKIFTAFILYTMSYCQAAKSAEEIIFVSGQFARTVEVKDVEKLIKTGESKGILSKIIKESKKKNNDISNILIENYEMPLVLTSKLMYSKIGEVILGRLSKIIYPSKVNNPSVTIPAIRAGIIKGIQKGNGKLNILLFIKSYPNKRMTINIPALSKVLNKVDSINDLVKFFSSSPLERLKEPRETKV